MPGKLDIDDALIRRLAALLDETGLSEIEIGRGSHHLRVARNSHHPNPAPAESAPLPAPPAETAPVAADEGEIDASHPGAVSAPMVGTVYLAPEPDAPPFVSPGEEVREGDAMFVIEAMKTMNLVHAPRDGRVARILVANATPVEYGEVLALLE